MGWTTLPVVWAQTAPGIGPSSLAPLALRRWCASQTLCSPDASPSLWGLWLWLGGLGALLLLGLLVQGPPSFLRQAFDIPAHFRLLGQALTRLRISARVVAVTIGMTVVAWTGSQTLNYRNEGAKADLQLLTKSRSLSELAIEQGSLAALTPLRDVLALSTNLVLLISTTLLVFRVCAERWGNLAPYAVAGRAARPGWGNLLWMGSGLLILYRLISLGSGAGELPLGNCLMIEVIVVPVLMALSDGFLLAWLLVELRNATATDVGSGPLDPYPAIELTPIAALACVLVMPSRYLATAVLLASVNIPAASTTAILGQYVRWQLLGWGLADVQACALPLVGLAGAFVWSRGSLGGTMHVFWRMLRHEGGRLAVALGVAGAATGVLSALAYLIVLTLPAQTWVLSAADGYAHYASLPIGLLTLAALVELGERSLPLATRVEPIKESATETDVETAAAPSGASTA